MSDHTVYISTVALQAEIKRLQDELVQLQEMYQDRDSDLAFEFKRANREEQESQHWKDRADDLGDELEELRIEIKRLTLDTTTVSMAGGCSKQGSCDCLADSFEYDGDDADDLAVVRRVLKDCT